MRNYHFIYRILFAYATLRKRHLLNASINPFNLERSWNKHETILNDQKIRYMKLIRINALDVFLSGEGKNTGRGINFSTKLIQNVFIEH